MKDLSVGDKVYSWDGRECSVQDVCLEAHPCKTLWFSDSTSLTLSQDAMLKTFTSRERKQWNRSNSGPLPPNWPSWTHQGRTKFSVESKSVQEISDTLKTGKRGDTNHSIPLCYPLEMSSPVSIPDPYYLGYWLGDGYSNSLHTLAVGDEDREYVLNVWPCLELKANGSLRALPKDFSWMGEYALKDNKHLPSFCYSLSREDRLAIVQGMMDSDGYAGSKTPHVEFCSIKKHLADALLILVRSLGEKPVMSVGRATLDGRFISLKYRVTWRPHKSKPFRMPRKADKITFGGSQESRNYHRMIKSCDSEGVLECVSIKVSSGDGIYLAGEGLTPVLAQ